MYLMFIAALFLTMCSESVLYLYIRFFYFNLRVKQNTK
jgi:hypothetical protein